MADIKRNALVVVSGGLDSVTMMHEYKDEIALALSFDYGSKHNSREIPMAKWQCNQLGIPHIVIPLSFMNAHFRSDLLSTGGDIPEGSYNDDNMKSTVVPFRNGIMLAISAGLAESRDLQKVFIANHFGDHAIYPDCRASFIDPMKLAIQNGTTNSVDMQAPYTMIDKTEIARRAAKLGVNTAMTYSCYKGGEKHCGKCATCVERKEAFKKAGVEDPTMYED